MSLEEALKMPWAWKTTDLVRKTHNRYAARACNFNLLWTETNSFHLFCLCLLVINDENSVSHHLGTLGAWNPRWLWPISTCYFWRDLLQRLGAFINFLVLFLNGYTVESDVAASKSSWGPYLFYLELWNKREAPLLHEFNIRIGNFKWYLNET